MKSKMEICIRGIIFFYLVWLGLVDYRKKIVPWTGIALGMAGGLVWMIWQCRNGNIQAIISGAAGAGMGGVFLGTAILSKGKLGCGDGFLIIILGVLLGIEEIVLLLFVAFVMAAIAAGRLIFLKRRRAAVLPLVPFMTAAYGICTIWRFAGG